MDNKDIKINIINEGKASIQQTNNDGSFSPFYNPAQELNRDLSVACIKSYLSYINKKVKQETKSNDSVSIIDAMSATGLRAVRYFKELPMLTHIIANDYDSKAVELIRINSERNGDVDGKIHVTQGDCIDLMYSKKSNFNIIDLDPYGSAISMIDSAIWSCKNNGLIMATFTDMQVLCGNYIDTCYYKYNSIPYKTNYCHEMAKRIALHSISISAAKYKKTIVPLLSFNAEFYIRLFILIKDSPEDCKDNIDKHSEFYQCRNCQYRKRIVKGLFEYKNNKKTRYKLSSTDSYHMNKCPVCDGHLVLIGPFYSGELFCQEYLNDVLLTLQSEEYLYLKYNTRLQSTIHGMIDELSIPDIVFNYDFSQMCSDLNLSVPKFGLYE